MKNLKTLSAAVLLTVFLAVPAFADCEPVPGQIPTGPCSKSSIVTTDDSIAPGETHGPPASDTVDIATVAEAALAALLIF